MSAKKASCKSTVDVYKDWKIFWNTLIVQNLYLEWFLGWLQRVRRSIIIVRRTCLFLIAPTYAIARVWLWLTNMHFCCFFLEKQSQNKLFSKSSTEKSRSQIKKWWALSHPPSVVLSAKKKIMIIARMVIAVACCSRVLAKTLS